MKSMIRTLLIWLVISCLSASVFAAAYPSDDLLAIQRTLNY